MKDFDDFDDYNNEETPRSRAMSWVVLAIALSGFVALAWYAYHSGSQSVTDGQMVVIKADETPIKEKPADAGGEQFPHQDKTIYDTISPYRTGGAKVEKLLPEPEEPIIEEEAPTATKTWVNDKIRSVSDAEEKINEQLEKTEAKKEETKVAEVKKEEPKKEVVPPAPVAKKEEPQVEAKKNMAEAPKAVPVKEVKKEEPKAAPAPAVSSGSGYKVQLGAYGSQTEAEQNWARISSKHAGILGGFSHVIVKADVPGKGTFYRLRVSGYETPDAAKQACTKLNAAGQGCFYAGR